MTDSAAGARLDFIIVGASVSGLGSAISLRNSGHNVLVLEKEPQLGSSGINGFVRTCPNGSKTLLDWGLLDAETRAKAAMMPGFAFFKCDAGYTEDSQPDNLGENRWTEEQLYEARGGYMQFRYQDFIQTLHAAATEDVPTSLSPRGAVKVLFGAEVLHVDVASDPYAVTLRSGEIHKADAIIGADGAKGVVRRTLLQAEEGADLPSGHAVYCSIIPKQLVLQNGLGWFCDDLGSSVWMGPNKGAWIIPVGQTSDLALCVFTRDDTRDGAWSDEVPEKRLVDLLWECDIRLHRLAALAGPPSCIQILNPHRLQSWVSKNGRVLALGDAAHPTVPGAMHASSIALEDAAFIGRIFSHTHNKERVPEFFHAFQEHRQVSNNLRLSASVPEARCTRIRASDLEYVLATIMPMGEAMGARDAGMRANHAAGRNAMAGNYQEMLDDFRMMFNYSGIDDADEWWINWGRFRDEDMPGTDPSGTRVDLSQLSISSVTSREGTPER
ncbi:hypothetical protein C8R45DRAFT_1221792 [Mycena sanguinolenta]|nr:hypothetical protein C8R45DRAFT_1221792 [Mycena sanguinolenta]